MQGSAMAAPGNRILEHSHKESLMGSDKRVAQGSAMAAPGNQNFLRISHEDTLWKTKENSAGLCYGSPMRASKHLSFIKLILKLKIFRLGPVSDSDGKLRNLNFSA